MMRFRALCLLLAALAAAPSAARAQQGATPSLGEAHAVRSGDTLWDLCSKYLNSPWYWPKIWSYNPQLTNPHWIYPGNEIRFYPGDEELPTQVAVSRAIDEGDDLAIPGALTDEDLVQTVGTLETDRGKQGFVWMTNVGFLSRDRIERSGRLVNARTSAILLTDFDTVYVTGQGLKEGDRLAIYRTNRDIVHPVTGEDYGAAIEIVGAVDIQRVGPEVATGRVARAFRGINRGDLVGNFPESFGARVRPMPNQAGAKGYVLETSGDILGPIGEYSLVYVDRGRNHGVQIGSTFEVYQRGDGYTYEQRGLPDETVARLLVLDVQAEASTAVVTNSVREFQVGDRVEMVEGR